MAEIAYTVTSTSEGDRVVTWSNVTEADTFEAFPNTQDYKQALIAASGTIGGATIVLNGSIDGTNYFQLTDNQGGNISFGSNGISTIQERPLFFQPATSGGVGESETVTILLRD